MQQFFNQGLALDMLGLFKWAAADMSGFIHDFYEIEGRYLSFLL